MEPLVSARLVEDTWRAVGAMSDGEIRRRQALCGKEQQELTGFVLAFTSELPPEALGLALYVHLVVIEAFRRSGAQFRKLKPTRIETTWRDNFGFVKDLRRRATRALRSDRGLNWPRSPQSCSMSSTHLPKKVKMTQ